MQKLLLAHVPSLDFLSIHVSGQPRRRKTPKKQKKNTRNTHRHHCLDFLCTTISNCFLSLHLFLVVLLRSTYCLSAFFFFPLSLSLFPILNHLLQLDRSQCTRSDFLTRLDNSILHGRDRADENLPILQILILRPHLVLGRSLLCPNRMN